MCANIIFQIFLSATVKHVGYIQNEVLHTEQCTLFIFIFYIMLNVVTCFFFNWLIQKLTYIKWLFIFIYLADIFPKQLKNEEYIKLSSSNNGLKY